MVEYLRAFIAVEVPEALKAKITEIQKALKKQGISTSDKGSMHITLLFLGEIKGTQAMEISEMLSGITQKRFKISFEGTGGFPSDRPRVVYIDIKEGSEQLKRLNSIIRERIAPLKIKIEEREFTPHLTIGRVRDHSSAIHASHFIEHEKDIKVGEFICESIKLMKSEPTSAGHLHTLIYELKLI